MVDIHCHVLPNIDDGARSWKVSEEMCQAALADGIRHVVATPHANSEFAYDRKGYLELLGELRGRTGGTIGLSLGCDFHISSENLDALFANPDHFLIENTKYLLIELNDFSIPPNYQQMVFRMRSELGVTPILTHPERYPLLQLHPEHVLRWIDAGCLVQVTANSLTGHWGKRAQDVAMWLLKKRAIHALATDAHDTKHRPPLLSRARRVASAELGEAAAARLVEENPRAIVEGRQITA